MSVVLLEKSWLSLLKEEFEESYMADLKKFLLAEKAAGKTIYPAFDKVFRAFNLCPANATKVVILGQDPYHQPNQANGLSFSVNKGAAVPPSLRNIYKELEIDVGLVAPAHGCLDSWTEQGVLLLNSVLTVEKSRPGSHASKGWERFTDMAIRQLSKQYKNIVFLLWGNYARDKATLIDTSRHKILVAAHPSPFSAHKGFLGCKHFSKANEILLRWGQKPINWHSISL